MNRKMTCLALFIACLGLIAAFGANSALPTALCKAEAKKGRCENPYLTKSTITGSAENATFVVGGLATIVCSEAPLTLEVTEPFTSKGLNQSASQTFSFAKCTLEKTIPCTVKPTPTPTSVKIRSTSENNGELIPPQKEVSKGISITCESILECNFLYESNLAIEGGSSSKIVASNVTLGSGTGPSCFAKPTATWTATYKMGQLFIGEYGPLLSLCKKSEIPCAATSIYPAPVALGAQLEAGSKAKMKLKISEGSEETEYTVACETSSMEGKMTQSTSELLPGELTSYAFGECGGTCSVKALKLPYPISMRGTGGGSASISLSVRLQVGCIGAYKCTYSGSPVLPLTGGSPAKIAIATTLSKVAEESEAKCGSQLTWEGKYSLSSPGGGVLWVEAEGGV